MTTKSHNSKTIKKKSGILAIVMTINCEFVIRFIKGKTFSKSKADFILHKKQVI